MNIKYRLDQLVQKFNNRVQTDEKLYNSVKGLNKTIQIAFTDDGVYNFNLKNTTLTLIEDRIDSAPDIKVVVNTEVFNAILSKEIDALSAYITKKLTVKASLMDKLLLTTLLK